MIILDEVIVTFNMQKFCCKLQVFMNLTMRADSLVDDSNDEKWKEFLKHAPDSLGLTTEAWFNGAAKERNRNRHNF